MQYNLDEIISNNIWVVMNPNAGSKFKRREKDIHERLGTDHIQYYMSTGKEDVKRIISWLAGEAEKRQSNILVLVVGGDGTYCDAINAKGGLSRLIFGFTDSGTSSDYARTLHLRKHKKMCKLVNSILGGEVILEELVKPIDLIGVDYDQNKSVKALNLFSIGFDGDVCKLVNDSYTEGGVKKKTSFVKASIQVLKDYKPINVIYEINNEPERCALVNDVLTLTVISGRYAASGMNYNPYGRVDDGALECLIAKHRSIPDLLRRIFHIKVLKDKQHIDSPADESGFNKLGIRYENNIQAMSLKIEKPKEKDDFYLNVDGESQLVENTKHIINIRVLPKAINAIYLPD